MASEISSQTAFSSRPKIVRLYRSESLQSLSCLQIDNESPHQIERIRCEKRREEHETMKVRKDALEEALANKLAELKKICLAEAELIGEIPPETPLAPDEPVPQIRKRVRTEFKLSDKVLISPIKSDERQKLSKMELEFEIQSKIVSATFKLCKQVDMKKSVRKQRKQAYEQAVVKLKDLEQKVVGMRQRVNNCEVPTPPNPVPPVVVDISSRAVRSSVVRTPIAIAISTSSDAQQINNPQQLPSPGPSLPRRPPLAPLLKAPLLPPNTPCQDSSARTKEWVETAIDAIRNYKVDDEADLHLAESCLTLMPPPGLRMDTQSSTDRIQKAASMVDSASVISHPVSNTMHPVPIPLSPNNPSNASSVEVNVLSVGHFQPYWEETKPYELSDFYKYSTKHRKKTVVENEQNCEGGNSKTKTDSNAGANSYHTVKHPSTLV